MHTFCAEKHVVGTPGSIVDTTLRDKGCVRTVAVTTPGFLSTLELVSRTDLIATVPARLAMSQAANFGLNVADPPVAPRPFSVSASWHRRTSGEGVIAWFVDRVRQHLT